LTASVCDLPKEIDTVCVKLLSPVSFLTWKRNNAKILIVVVAIRTVIISKRKMIAGKRVERVKRPWPILKFYCPYIA
jgi:hypothetical protein